MTTSASLLRDLQAGVRPGPITKALAAGTASWTRPRCERVHQQKLRDITGDRSLRGGPTARLAAGSCPRSRS